MALTLSHLSDELAKEEQIARRHASGHRKAIARISELKRAIEHLKSAQKEPARESVAA